MLHYLIVRIIRKHFSPFSEIIVTFRSLNEEITWYSIPLAMFLWFTSTLSLFFASTLLIQVLHPVNAIDKLIIFYLINHRLNYIVTSNT